MSIYFHAGAANQQSSFSMLFNAFQWKKEIRGAKILIFNDGELWELVIDAGHAQQRDTTGQ